MMTKRQRRKGKRVKKRNYSPKRHTYNAYSEGKRVDPPEQLKEKAERKSSGSWRLVVSGILIVSMIAAKLLAPQVLERIRNPLLNLMGADTDFVAVFSTVGKVMGNGEGWDKKLQEVYVAVFGTQSGADEADTEAEAWCYTSENIPDNAHMSQKLLGISYQKPVSGTISDKFGYRIHPIDHNGQFHYGIDLQADEGVVIYSFAAGEVTAVGESTTLGNYVTVLHDGGYQTLYAHCSRVTASSGQLVQMGDPIAEVGETGQTTGPHLHFELLLDTLYINPVYYVTE